MFLEFCFFFLLIYAEMSLTISLSDSIGILHELIVNKSFWKEKHILCFQKNLQQFFEKLSKKFLQHILPNILNGTFPRIYVWDFPVVFFNSHEISSRNCFFQQFFKKFSGTYFVSTFPSGTVFFIEIFWLLFLFL